MRRMKPIHFLLWAVVCCLALGGQPAHAQSEESQESTAEPSASDEQPAEEAVGEPAYEPITIVDPQVPLDQLRVLVKPLTKTELEGEADAWFELLRQKARQIAAAQLGVKKTNEALLTDDSAEAQAAIDAAQNVEARARESAEAAEAELTETAQEQLGIEEGQPSESVDAQVEDDAETDAAASETDEAPTVAEADRASETPASAAATGDTEAAATEIKEELLTDVSELQDQRTGLADRLDVVLTSLEAKGGDVAEYRDYVRAVSGIDIDTQDASAAWAAISGWLTSQEGGQRWTWNLGKFFLILLASYVVAKIVAGVTNWLLERRLNLTQLAEKLISRTIKNLIMLIGLAIALTALEIDITPILAAIGAAGFIIGFALQGTLSNFASGLMILLNKPFDVGDVVTAGGVTGKIDEMNLVSTKFLTFDNQSIHVPNNEIWGNVITNITANDIRRVDMEFGIGYDDDFEEAEQIMKDIVQEHELVLDDPEPVIVMHELADSSVNIVCRPWAKTGDWWTVKTEVTRRVKQRFDRAGISIPYPQTDVHIHQQTDVRERPEPAHAH